ncbi:DEAD/DEAH box helicase [Gordonia sp. HY002]|uniref:DEAD/DEAH box helicase n=1 Tax=Gordonia zhenghanii TaxID=2911516 RepID=UPI001EEF89BF|nr:DEAD/DEAH box helicase [Gordonia zhenghanii]MCF8571424.1 DEAD/DEAH box helicase [Gordonia zhenghanii]MCF8608057.1 DEAD/DEAH box helicase [Gordonia zhenghanii]
MKAPTLRVLWRPGVGLAVWPAIDASSAAAGTLLDDVAEVPSTLVDLIGGRRLRHPIELRTTTGGREFVHATAVGVPTAVQLLDRFDHLTPGGDVAFYRYLLAGVRSAIDAGAVAPGTVEIAGIVEVRWLPMPTSAWRAWLQVAHGAAPAAVADNGGSSAITDFANELIDHEVRRRIGDRVGSQVPLIAGLAAQAPSPVPDLPGARGAWTDWLATVGPEAASLVLRLHEPPDEPTSPGDERWRLEVCRHTATGDVVAVAPHRIDPHELESITGDLATAVRAFGPLATADTDPHSLDFLLDTPAVDDLFTHGAAAISEAGITVLLPRTIAAISPSLSLRAAKAIPDGGSRPGFVGLDEISDFEWRLALGDAPDSPELTQSDLDELAQQHGNLVKVRGRWLRAEGAALHRAAAFLAAQRAVSDPDAKPTMGELLNLVADPVDRLPVPVSSVHGLGWLDDVARGGAIVPAPVQAPASLHAQLRPYQQRGLDWLHTLGELGAGAVLADDMGLGKTVQVIALLTTMRVDDGHRPPALVVCPMSVIGNWHRELATFAPSLRVAVHHGAGRSVDSIRSGDVDVVLTTFATLARDRADLAALPWSELVVDEAQHVKNVNTAAAKALRAVPARLRIALTGTPVENRLEDLRAVVDLVNPGMLGTASAFRSRFAEPIERDRDRDALRRLNALTGPFILRRTKTDPDVAPDLPDKSELIVRTNLTTEQAGLYQAVLNELHEALAERNPVGERRRSVLAALTRLKQICNHPAHYLADGSPLMRRRHHRSGKVELMIDVLTTLIAEGDKALVFTQFAAFADLLAGWLSPILGVEVPVLHGGRSRTERDTMVERFQSDGGPPVLLATLKAGGTGLNLVAANHVIHADRWWNPAVEDQATDRAYRIGQTRNVQVRKFVCVGTLEERIDEMVTAKRELSQLTVKTGESWLSDLDDDALFDLLALRDEAVGE